MYFLANAKIAQDSYKGLTKMKESSCKQKSAKKSEYLLKYSVVCLLAYAFGDLAIPLVFGPLAKRTSSLEKRHP